MVSGDSYNSGNIDNNSGDNIMKKLWIWFKGLFGWKPIKTDISVSPTHKAPQSHAKAITSKAHIHYWKYFLGGLRACRRCSSKQYYSRAKNGYL